MMASLMLRRIVVQSTRVVASAMRTTALPTMCPVATPLIMSRSIATRTLKSITAKPKRAFKNPRYKLKSKQCAVKRFIVMGGGRLKRGHSGKRHLNAKKSRKRMSRLKNKVTMSGTWCKKMKSLIL